MKPKKFVDALFGASTEHFVVFLEKTQDHKIVPEVYQIKSWNKLKNE